MSFTAPTKQPIVKPKEKQNMSLNLVVRKNGYS